MKFQLYSQDTIVQNNDNCLFDTTLIKPESLTPLVIKKYDKIYYSFDTKQTEYLYNSLLERDFYFDKYLYKKNDFDTIVLYYDDLIKTLEEQNNLKDTIIKSNDILLNTKIEECDELENEYINENKKQKRKTRITTIVGVVAIIGLILIL